MSLKKRHSTRAEAVSVARRVGARACLLTHFSQRYPKQPPAYPSENDQRPVVGFGFDGSLLPLVVQHCTPNPGGVRVFVTELGKVYLVRGYSGLTRHSNQTK